MTGVAIDLFCGVGGLTKGLLMSGVKVAAGYDIDESCRYPYEVNNGAKFYLKSVDAILPQELCRDYPFGCAERSQSWMRMVMVEEEDCSKKEEHRRR